MMLVYNGESVENYYKINFALHQHYKYTLTELEEMLPYEREIYLKLVQNHIEEQKKLKNGF